MCITSFVGWFDYCLLNSVRYYAIAPVAAKSAVPGRAVVLRSLLDVGTTVDTMECHHIPGGV
jgi:hypothetical protein